MNFALAGLGGVVGVVVAGFVLVGVCEGVDAVPVVVAGVVGVPAAPVDVVELELPHPAMASVASPRRHALREGIPRAILSPPTPKRLDPTSLSPEPCQAIAILSR